MYACMYVYARMCMCVHACVSARVLGTKANSKVNSIAIQSLKFSLLSRRLFVRLWEFLKRERLLVKHEPLFSHLTKQRWRKKWAEKENTDMG